MGLFWKEKTPSYKRRNTVFIVLPAKMPSTMLLEVFLFWDTDCNPQYGYISLKLVGWFITGYRSPELEVDGRTRFLSFESVLDYMLDIAILRLSLNER